MISREEHLINWLHLFIFRVIICMRPVVLRQRTEVVTDENNMDKIDGGRKRKKKMVSSNTD